MQNAWTKGLVVGIIVLFVGTGIIPSISGNSTINNISEPRGKSTTDWWPMFHHDLNHSGYSTSTAPNTNALLWKYELYGGGYSSMTITDGRIYIDSARDINNTVCCLNASTGAFIWSFLTGDPYRPLLSTPAVENGKVYVGSTDYKVYCLDAQTGLLIWNYTTGFCIYSSPTVVDGKVYIGSYDNEMYCLNAETGEKIWNYTTGGSILSSAAVSDDKVYFGSSDYNKTFALF